MKGSNAHWYVWGQYVAVAAAYEAVYEITYHLSPPQFLLTTGLRLACMLLLPMRFWLAIALGECVPLIENAVFCAEKFGMAWAFLVSIPTVGIWWPALQSIRTRWPLNDSDGRLRMHVFLGATFCVSVLTAVTITVTWLAATMNVPGKFPSHEPVQILVSYLLGAYLGALTLTPVILALRERFRANGSLITIHAIWRSTLLRDVIWWVAPTLAALVWFTLSTLDEPSREVARFALLWPVLGLTWRHGWHGTAIGGMMASFALASTASGPFDSDTLKVQVVLALVLSGALVAGARSREVAAMVQINRS
ncbi:hypothetical protein GCM10009552_07060 [Rothia nasimurium]|uniref:MASE1 domain-containing protein n=1 Tax=Luteibacter anthropi TaxID=564369 RepID=A0A7X5U8Y3_9GAMM|nr:MASE1 domain-containing protein [Luteibacter anthropi]NII06046.1 hypothetical protein [Luteibacter anthropi]